MNTKSTIENKFQLNKLFLIGVFFYSFLSVVINFYKWTLKKSFYEYSDWLLNYQGGFIRRGFAGEIFFQIHNKLNFDLANVVLFFVILFNIIFFYFLFKKISVTKLNFLNTLIIFSPLSFTYLAFNQTIAGRKEILFFSLIAVFFYFFNNFKFYQIKYFIIFISIVSILTHDGFLFYIPYLIFFFLFSYPKKNKLELFFQILPIGIFLILIFSFLIFYTVFSKPDIGLFCNSVISYVNKCPDETYMAFMSKYSIKQVFFLVLQEAWTFNYFVKYPIYFFICFLPLYFGFKNFKNYRIKKLMFYLIISTVCTTPVFLFGSDYGRYIHWQYIIILFIYFHCLNSKNFSQNNTNYFFSGKIKKYILFVIIFFYGFVWSVPYYGDQNIKILSVYKNLFSYFF
jgi:hypothetical protein